MKKILLSVLTIGMVSAVAFGATSAYFSDTETSTGNTFTAGEIDLKIGNATWYNGVAQDGGSPDMTWGVMDVIAGTTIYYSFDDFKPGDWVENTVTLDVDNNDAWACYAITLTSSAENGVNDAENEAGDDTLNGDFDGELSYNLNYFFWADDGDNVYENDETGKIIAQGTVSVLPINGSAEVFDLVDASNDYFGDTYLLASGTYYMGQYWCFGSITENAVVAGVNTPVGGSGFTCNGNVPLINRAQGDDVTATLQFYAVQQKNNTSFECSTWIP